MKKIYEKLIEEAIERIENGEKVQELLKIYSGQFEINEAFYIVSQAQIKIMSKNK